MAKPKQKAAPKKDTSPKVYQREKINFDLHIRELPWTQKQKAMIELGTHRDSRILFVSGAAGTSKTTVSMRIALQLLNEKKVSDIVCIRAAVESSDSKLGYLPGDIAEKYSPYMGPFEDKLEELLPESEGKKLKLDNRLIYQPINFVRGASWTARCVIVDECFPKDTVILLADGKRATISQLYDKQSNSQPLPLARTFNEKTNKFEDKQILSVTAKGNKSTVTVCAANRKIRCTPEHLFLTSRGWVKAEELQQGDCMYTNGGAHQTVNALSADQEQLVIGSLLGDGSVSTHGFNRYRLRVIHGMEQAEYCRWKASIMDAPIEHIKKNGFAGKPATRFCSKVFSMPSLATQFTPGKKTCPDWVLEKIDARGLAVWYMDDGSYYTSGYCTLHTESFDYATQLKLVAMFKDKFGIEAKIQKSKGEDWEYYNLRINKGDGNCDKFLKLIAPYMHSNLSRKNPQSVDVPEYGWGAAKPEYKFCVVDRVLDNNITEEVYDLEVQDNHNFMVASKTQGKACRHLSGVVVHNCQNMSANEIQTLMTRIGKFTKMIICADSAQSDLPKNKQGGFERISKMFDNDSAKAMGIYSLGFTTEDIVRSELCKFIVETFEANPNVLKTPEVHVPKQGVTVPGVIAMGSAPSSVWEPGAQPPH